ncbi:unnamed protein product [Spirodela intermedia]|uniref:Nuclear condensin complex subunit 3 C-terminal domain-containing protein n=1 Tax=Spirodela intermedia TaxID=51605 RepID=A0A7I8KU78_SPIIN|nr:unnamed protein product [Spirodela intermedia]
MGQEGKGGGEGKQLALKIARILDECRLSQAVHQRKLRELSAIRSTSHVGFVSSFTWALTPLFEVSKKTASIERIVRFVSTFAAPRGVKTGNVTCDSFLVEFLRFLLVAARSASKTARLRACQIVSQIIDLLPDDADVSDEVWDGVIYRMKERVEDKVPDVRACAARALSRFANDGGNCDIIDLLLRALSQEPNTDVRKTIVQSLPPTNSTLASIIDCTLDVHESVRKAAYVVLASKFPLQSLSIKLRTLLLQRGLTDRSSSVTNECLKMLKEEWLMKCCDGDPITLLRYLDVETYESVGETVMEALLKEGAVQVQEGQSIRHFLSSTTNKNEGQSITGVQLMEAEVALYWRTVCRHLQAQAQAKGSDAAATTGTEAAVYASEATTENDLLESVLPVTVSDYIELVEAHLSAGSNFRFASRQLLLLGAMLDFSDVANRNVASRFVRELLCRPFEHEIDDDGHKVMIGDGISLGGDRDWCRAVAALAKKVHASVGEFEEVVTGVVEELARPCRERTADLIGWTQCLAVTGLLLENAESYRCLQGKAIEPAELLHSLLLPAARHIHLDVQRVAARCLGLFGLVERRPSEELVKQLRLAFINGPPQVRVMASRALIDLATWHGPQELDRAIGLEPPPPNEKNSFTPVDLSSGSDDLSLWLLDLFYAGLKQDEWGQSSEEDEQETVHGVLGEGFAKILLLRENYPSIPASLHPLILGRLICLYFCSEHKEFERLKQCLSVFFDHYAALSEVNKACISRAFVPVMRSMWPGVNGNAVGYQVLARKRAVNASRFMLQLMQTPVYQSKAEEAEKSPDSLSTSGKSTLDMESGEEGLAIRIGAEVANFPARTSAAGRSYISALCRVAVALKFRSSQQEAIKFMRELLEPMMEAASKEKELLKELSRMAAKLRALDESPDQDLPAEVAGDIHGRLQLEVDLKIDAPTKPATRPPRAAPPRRERRFAVSSRSSSSASDEDWGHPSATPATAARAQRRSKTAAMSRLTAGAAADGEGDSEVTSEGVSDEDSE